ncbi:MAG: carboxylating nicotinate-nucleotide diphosphorylase [Candidatus Kapabacteria bacterium]|nr:carboxylating nicotinate-nucleotide diphosphorylase [Candidatus Kapabacteria bacterium]MCS7169448.1 carboxylating nicotinate-nucleotide diphosphorylase [Candidatus Kapabacteria bacterium]MDW7997345.1 carboxylating nicotinate-nucleotide diphosphorylase [Bacteroidota bacterium]MDW8224950.1 carboxylating nicotinate-nucleotide diphosphorylase [Bacteroidota bacterium]
MATRAEELLNDSSVVRLVQIALSEDIGQGDVTTESLFAGRTPPLGRGRVMAKESGVVCGLPVAALVFREVHPEALLQPLASEGVWVEKGTVIAEVVGPASALLTAERTALNFLQRMSGVATLTRRFAQAVQGTGTAITDTRKTIPGWRRLDKYATAIGGAQNHRMGLYDMVLIKDNHIAAAGGIRRAVELCRRELGELDVLIEVEARSLVEVREVLQCEGVHRIMFDNFNPDDVRRAVELVAGKLETEASGNIGLENVRRYAETGVQFISVGAITHSAPALDISLELVVPSLL